MRVSALLTELYPPAVRERWGAEISHEVAESGIRSWPDTLTGAARLWLHPSDWPETIAGQTRCVLTVALLAITAVTALLLRATQPSSILTADLRHPATSLWLAPILLGTGLAAPLPPLRWDAIRHLISMAIRTLTAPAVAVAAIFLTAHSSVTAHPAGIARTALIICYWATLGFTTFRLCTLIARIAPTANLPARRRLRAALLTIGTGLALAACQSLLAIIWTTPQAGALTVTLTLGLLAAVTIGAGHDLRKGRA